MVHALLPQPHPSPLTLVVDTLNPNLRVCTENIPLPAHPCLALWGAWGCSLKVSLGVPSEPHLHLNTTRSHIPQPIPLPLLRPQGNLTVLGEGGPHLLETQWHVLPAHVQGETDR